MAIECLDNVIGFRGICETPDTSLFINDMPDSGIEKLESLTTQDFETFRDVWDKIYRRAAVTLVSDIRKNMPVTIRAKGVVDNAITHIQEDEQTLYTGTGIYSGVFLRTYGSPFIDTVINYVGIWLNAIGNVPVFIFDAQTGQQLYTEIFVGAVGYNLSLIHI